MNRKHDLETGEICFEKVSDESKITSIVNNWKVCLTITQPEINTQLCVLSP